MTGRAAPFAHVAGSPDLGRMHAATAASRITSSAWSKVGDVAGALPSIALMSNSTPRRPISRIGTRIVVSPRYRRQFDVVVANDGEVIGHPSPPCPGQQSQGLGVAPNKDRRRRLRLRTARPRSAASPPAGLRSATTSSCCLRIGPRLGQGRPISPSPAARRALGKWRLRVVDIRDAPVTQVER